MRNKLIYKYILFTLLLLVSTSHAQRGARVGYIDMNVILENVEEYKKASDLLDKNIENWKKEIELKKIQLKQYQDQLNTERVLLTTELIQDRELEIQDFALEIIDLQEKRFGPRGDMIIQRTKLIQPVQDQILAIVKLIAEEKNYDFIFDRSSNFTMLYSAKNYDISDLVIKRLNREQRIQDRKEILEEIKTKATNSNN